LHGQGQVSVATAEARAEGLARFFGKKGAKAVAKALYPLASVRLKKQGAGGGYAAVFHNESVDARSDGSGKYHRLGAALKIFAQVP
jgi:hypothetical protein